MYIHIYVHNTSYKHNITTTLKHDNDNNTRTMIMIIISNTIDIIHIVMFSVFIM